MGSGISGFLASLVNFLFILAVALGLSKEDVKTVFIFSLLYVEIGLCLWSVIPEFLYRRGVVDKREKKFYSELLLVSWVVSIFLILPKIKGAVRW